jgi:hypothetical protein
MFNDQLYYSKNVPQNSFIISNELDSKYLETTDESTFGSGISSNIFFCVSSTDNWVAEPTRFMTPEEIVQALKKFEAIYNLSSSVFYERWKKRDVDDISDSIEWSLMYRILQNYFNEDK